jgi:heterodisulfide reductase subunit B
MRYGYYPGCSLEGISVEYDISTRNLFDALAITIEELPDWICCGTLAAPSISRLLGVATPLWNVAKAEEHGFDQLVAPCSACVYHFKYAASQVAQDQNLQADVEAVIEMPLNHLPRVVHPLELLLNDSFEPRIRQAVKRDLSELKVVCYYGCHISRPVEVMDFDDPENPESMDRLLSWVGINSLDWSAKVDCCGAHFSMIKPSIMVDLCAQLFEAALEVGAEAIVVGCPMCHANLDTRQDQIAIKLGQPLDIPVLYFSQVLGYALGLEPELLGFKKHIIDPIPLMIERCQQRQRPKQTPIPA